MFESDLLPPFKFSYFMIRESHLIFAVGYSLQIHLRNVIRGETTRKKDTEDGRK